MATINKSDYHGDRASHGGKGDLPRGDHEVFRAGRYWLRSECCNAPVADASGPGPDGEEYTCKKCECFTRVKQ